MRWLLPEHIEDILPEEAMRIEWLRRSILDLFIENDFQLVMPPLVEFTDSLLTGTGHDLDLRTFKLVDQLSGRMMGIRADITPQVARIDAHLLNRKGVTRLCYCGSVLHARPAGPGRRASRSRSERRYSATPASLATLRSRACCAGRLPRPESEGRAWISGTSRCSAR